MNGYQIIISSSIDIYVLISIIFLLFTFSRLLMSNNSVWSHDNTEVQTESSEQLSTRLWQNDAVLQLLSKPFDYELIEQEGRMIKTLRWGEGGHDQPWIEFLRDEKIAQIVEKGYTSGLFAKQDLAHQLALSAFFDVGGLAARLHQIPSSGLEFSNKTNSYLKEVIAKLQRTYNIAPEQLGDLLTYLHWYMFMAEKGASIPLPEGQRLMMNQSSLNQWRYVVETGPVYGKWHPQYSDETKFHDLSHIYKDGNVSTYVADNYVNIYRATEEYEICLAEQLQVDPKIIRIDEKANDYAAMGLKRKMMAVRDTFIEEHAGDVFFYHESVGTDKLFPRDVRQQLKALTEEKLKEIVVDKLPTAREMQKFNFDELVVACVRKYLEQNKVAMPADFDKEVKNSAWLGSLLPGGFNPYGLRKYASFVRLADFLYSPEGLQAWVAPQLVSKYKMIVKKGKGDQLYHLDRHQHVPVKFDGGDYMKQEDYTSLLLKLDLHIHNIIQALDRNN